MTAPGKRGKIKIGTLLIENGMITDKQLDEALKSQVIFGGRLGANLVELGYLDEEALAYFLSEKTGVPYAHPKTLLDINKEIIALVPKEIAERYRVLPVAVKKKKLHLVMADPLDFDAIKEISFITGYTIEPMVTPEMRLSQALEVHYGIPRDIRYIPFRDNLKEKAEREGARQGTSAPAVTSEAAPLQPIKKGVGREDEVSEEVLQEKIKRLKEKRTDMLTKHTPPPSIAEQPTPHKSATPADAAIEQLKSAPDRNVIGRILLDYMTARFPMGAILAVRGDVAQGWCAAGYRNCDENIQKIRVPLSVPSILKDSAEQGYTMQSAGSANPMDNMIRKIIRVEDSLCVAVSAVFFHKVIVCFLLAVGPKETFTSYSAEEMKEVAKEAGKAFARLIKPLQKEHI